MTEPNKPKYRWMWLHGQRVKVQLCAPGEAHAPRTLTELATSNRPAARHEQRTQLNGDSPHHGGHSSPEGYGEADTDELEGEIRQTRGGWASGWGVEHEEPESDE